MIVSSNSGKRSTRDIEYDPGAMQHFLRVMADGGTLPNDRNTNALLTGLRNAWGGDLRDRLLVDGFGLFTSYKLNSTIASKQYAFNPVADFVQATAGRQPYLFPYNGKRYFYAAVETCLSAYVIGGKTIKELGVRLKLSSAARNCTMGIVTASVTDFYNISITRTGTNTYTINWAFGANNYTDTGITLTDNAVYYLKISSASHGASFLLSVSTDRVNWTVLRTKSFADWANVNTSHIFFGSTPGLGTQYKTSGATGSEFYEGWVTTYSNVTTSFDFSKYVVSNTNSFASDGLTFNIGTKSGANISTQVITRPAMMYYDGSNDKLQSGTFTKKYDQCTLFALINFGHNLTSTRYFINDSGDKIRVYSDGTNVYVGDSGSVFNVGSVPTGTALLTFVKNGAQSYAQINQGIPVFGDGGSLVPTDLLLGGLYANDTACSISNTILPALFDGELSPDSCFYTQQLINDLLQEITSTSIW